MKYLSHAAAGVVLLLGMQACSGSGPVVNELTLDNQAVALEGVANAREFGGYKIGKKVIADGQLIRSGNLSGATDEAVATLKNEYHLAKVFDFRSSAEHDAQPDRIVDDCTYYWLPCLENMISAQSISSASAGGSSDPLARIMGAIREPALAKLAFSMYPAIVFDEQVQANYEQFLDELAVLPKGHAALWHCSQGKDRAGWGSAFLLAALGADRDLIVQDFALSNVSYQPTIDAIVSRAPQLGLTDEQIEIVYALVGVSVEKFEETLDMIDEQYGSMDNYLEQALHCDAAQRKQLRKRFLK